MVTEQGRRLANQAGVIKSCMLPGGLCASFANSPELAARDFACFAQQFPEGAGFADAIAFFERSSVDTGNDYILSFSSPPRLVKIAGGKRTPGMSPTQWIGDRRAYERFREYEANHRKKAEAGRAVNAVLFANESEGSPASDLYSVMRHVIADKEIDSVGGFACVVSSGGVHYRHSVYSDMLYDWPENEVEEFVLSMDDQIDFGATGENAGYALAQISTGYLGLNSVGFYMLKARKLFYYLGRANGLPDRCRVLSDVAPADIAPKLTKAYGIDLNWLLLITSAGMAHTKSVRRSPPGTEGPRGVRLSFFSHANTFPAPVDRPKAA
jgi:hypothetical protein